MNLKLQTGSSSKAGGLQGNAMRWDAFRHRSLRTNRGQAAAAAAAGIDAAALRFFFLALQTVEAGGGHGLIRALGLNPKPK